jgi:hypothetical protein
MLSSNETGVDERDLQRYIEEQIYTLPGTDNHRDAFTVLLTGSRAIGAYRNDSDIDIDVLCSETTFRTVHAASLKADIVQSRAGFFSALPSTDTNWGRYFGSDKGAPHFSITPLENVKKQYAEFESPAIWIWNSAKVINDPNRQFQCIRDDFHGYPQEDLVRQVKYHWLMCWYWAINAYPFHHHDDAELSVATAAVVNAIHEMQKVFFLVEGRSYPYTEKLPVYVPETSLGRQFGPLLQSWVDRVVGKIDSDLPVWERLDKVNGQMLDDEGDPQTHALEEACVAAILSVGVDETWMNNYYSNIHELLYGELGPAP